MGELTTDPADVTVQQLGVHAGERVAVLHNRPQAGIAARVAEAAERRGASVRALEFAPMTRPGMEPPAEVLELLGWADVGVGLTSVSLSHTRARMANSARGMRFASMPTLTEEIFTRCLPVPYAYMTAVGDALAARLTAADTVHITSPVGTDLTLSVAGRQGRNDDGDLRAPGAFGNLPAGEGYIAPVEDAGSGTLVVDGSMAGWGLLEDPLVITVADGRLVAAEGPAGATILDLLDAAGPSGRHVGELGIGTNPAALITGVVLEDEKALGTVHVAFGTSTGVGGVNQSTVHLDGVARDATLRIGDEVVLANGAFTFAEGRR